MKMTLLWLNLRNEDPKAVSLLSDVDEFSKADSHASKLSSIGSVDAIEVLDVYNSTVNKALAALNVSPVSSKKLKEKEYPKQKVKEVADAVRSKLN
jgi:hypothetical protein